MIVFSHLHAHRGKYGLLGTAVGMLAFVSQLVGASHQAADLWRWHEDYLSHERPCGTALPYP